jgi:heme/copper-type cytochrome/quinol oxidase subunit 2
MMIIRSIIYGEVYSVKSKYKVAFISLFLLSVILIVVMVIHSVFDYKYYLQHPEFSAPFSAYLLFNGTTYSIPIIILLVLSFIFRKKSKRL